MTRYRCHICDLCASEGIITLATSQYWPGSGGGPFDACEEHTEEVKGYGFDTLPFPQPGDIDLHD